MLVLSRKEGERIMIGDDIALTVIRTNRNDVRLGIDAPTGIRIMREELAVRNTCEIPGIHTNGDEPLDH